MDSVVTQSRVALADEKHETKVYLKRWIILFTFCVVSFMSAFNWIEHNIVQDVTVAFYNQSLPADISAQNDAVNWFSMVYMLVYIPLVFPAMFFLDRKGLKLALLLGASLTFLGALIKCFAVRPDLFLVAMLGQTICAIAQAFTLSVPARLSALWFGSNEVALATSVGVFGNQLGAAIGFLVPPLFVKLGGVSEMKTEFYYLYITVAGVCFASTLLTLIFVSDQPEIPPTLSQLEVRSEQTKNTESDFFLFKKSLKALMSNPNFLLVFVSYGMNVGVFYAISTLLNQIILEYYSDQHQTIGYLGLILILSGLPGSIIGGIVLDKTKKFKLVTSVFYIGSLLTMIIFTATLKINIYMLFGTISLLGFFMSGYLPVGFELATEVTYPEPEGLSCGLLNSSAQFFGLVFTFAQGKIIGSYGAIYGNVFLCVSLLIGSILTVLVKSDLRRQNLLNSTNQVNPGYIDITVEF